MYYVYYLVNERKESYVGYTNDLKRRLREHNAGDNKSTRGHQWQLVYYEAYLHKDDAVKRERSLKLRGQSKRHLKERIANSISAGYAELSAREAVNRSPGKRRP